jgi:hypothetical protein
VPAPTCSIATLPSIFTLVTPADWESAWSLSVIAACCAAGSRRLAEAFAGTVRSIESAAGADLRRQDNAMVPEGLPDRLRARTRASLAQCDEVESLDTVHEEARVPVYPVVIDRLAVRRFDDGERRVQLARKRAPIFSAQQ